MKNVKKTYTVILTFLVAISMTLGSLSPSFAADKVQNVDVQSDIKAEELNAEDADTTQENDVNKATAEEEVSESEKIAENEVKKSSDNNETEEENGSNLKETPAPLGGSSGGGAFKVKTLTIQPGRTSTELNFNWYAPKGAENSMIRFRKSTDKDYAEPVKASIKEAELTSDDAIAATISGLDAGTAYNYSISNDNGETWSIEYSFKTPNPGAFRFAFVGDPQLKAADKKQDGTSKGQDANGKAAKDKTVLQGWEDTLKLIENQNPDFIASAGDQVDKSSGDEVEYTNLFEPSQMQKYMFAPVMGNHDSNNQFVWHYNLPNEQDVSKYVTGELPSASSIPADKGNYFYSYNNALFIVLNDAPYPESVDEAKHYIDAYEQTIQAAKAAYPEANWTFVQHHKSTASVAKHCADDDIEYYVNAGLENLFEKQDIDFVLAGHDHVYARSFVMENGKRISDIATDVVNPKGTLYMTANTATGIKYYDIFTLYQQDNEDYPKLANGKAGSKEYLKATSLPLSAHTADQSKLPGYTMIDVQSDSVTFQTYNTYDNPDTPTDESKQVFDKYTVKREPMGNKIGALNNDKAGLKAELTGRYTSGLNDKDGGVCEIVAYNPDNDKIYAVNGKSGALLITDKKDGENGKIADLKAVHIPVDKIIEGNVEGFEYGDMTSVAVITSTKEIAIAVQEKAYNKNGKILFLDYDGNYKSVVDAGVQPDMIKYDEETNTVLTANEGEPREGTGGEDPAGSVTIYDVANKTVKTVGFEKFDDKRDELVKKGVVLMKKTVPSKDLEPEYIATAGGYAYVSLQEANSIAKLNIAKGEFESIMPVGFTDYSKTKIDIDKSDKTYAPKTYETLMGIRMPDGIAAYEQGGKT